MRGIRTLRAMWRALETELRQLLNGHEEGNLRYKPRRSLRATAPALDPTGVASAMSQKATSGQPRHRRIRLQVPDSVNYPRSDYSLTPGETGASLRSAAPCSLFINQSNQSSPKSSTGCSVRMVPLPPRRSSAAQYLSHPQQIRSGWLGWIGKFIMTLGSVIAVECSFRPTRAPPTLRLQGPEHKACDTGHAPKVSQLTRQLPTGA